MFKGQHLLKQRLYSVGFILWEGQLKHDTKHSVSRNSLIAHFIYQPCRQAELCVGNYICRTIVLKMMTSNVTQY